MNYFFTKKGLELKRLDIKLQEEKVRSIGCEVGEEAGTNCDWHDNFGYEEAKRKLETESGLLKRLKNETEGGIVIEITEQNEKVAIGVTAIALVDELEKEFTIGAYGESDPNLALISYISPLGQALLNMKVGESKDIILSGRGVKIKITRIDPPSSKYEKLAEVFFKQRK